MRIDHRKLCTKSRRSVTNAIRRRSAADGECLGNLGGAEFAGRVTTVSPRTPSARPEWKRALDRSVSRSGRPVPGNQCARSPASRMDRGTVPRGLAPCRRARPLHDEAFVDVLVSMHRLSVEGILAYVGEGQAAAGRGLCQKFERRDEAGVRQVLRDAFSDKKRALGRGVAVRCQHSTQVLPVEIDRHEVDVRGDCSELLVQPPSLGPDVFRLIDLPHWHVS